MKLSRHARKSVALLTAVLVFLCQTAFAAAACAVDGAAAQSAASAPCHESMGDVAMSAGGEAPQAPAVHSVCDAPKAVSQAIQMPIVALADLPSITLPTLSVAVVRISALTPHAHESPCSSPPLTLLHCRLLN